MKNIEGIIEGARKVIQSHCVDGGSGYSRWIWQNATNDRELVINPYGCADAANIRYMIGEFPATSAERENWIINLQGFQNPISGLFEEATHHPYHTTAHCVEALELFEEKAVHPLFDMQPYLQQHNLEQFLDGLCWSEDPWLASHQGAGIYAAMVLMEEADMQWEDRYFRWLSIEADPETGFWRKGQVKPVLKADSFAGVRAKPSVFPHLAASFHYLFNHEYAHRPLPYPDKIVDTCLAIYKKNDWETLGKKVSFAEIDWVYCLNRGLRHSGHRFDEAKTALHDFALTYIDYLEHLDYETDDGFNDMHSLFGCICALAELQNALPGELVTNKPLKLVLDRRPFI